MMQEFFQDLWRIRNILIVFLTPIILLPLPLVAGTSVRILNIIISPSTIPSVQKPNMTLLLIRQYKKNNSLVNPQIVECLLTQFYSEQLAVPAVWGFSNIGRSQFPLFPGYKLQGYILFIVVGCLPVPLV